MLLCGEKVRVDWLLLSIPDEMPPKSVERFRQGKPALVGGSGLRDRTQFAEFNRLLGATPWIETVLRPAS